MSKIVTSTVNLAQRFLLFSSFFFQQLKALYMFIYSYINISFFLIQLYIIIKQFIFSFPKINPILALYYILLNQDTLPILVGIYINKFVYSIYKLECSVILRNKINHGFLIQYTYIPNHKCKFW